MSENRSKICQTIHQLEWLIQTDLGHRGIHHLPGNNLCTFCQGNLYRAVKFLAENPGIEIAVATGFFIPTANPPAPENDGLPGALFIARGLNQLGYSVQLISDANCILPLKQGLQLFPNEIDLIEFPLGNETANQFTLHFFHDRQNLQCLISIECVGPCHTESTFLNQPRKPGKEELERFKLSGPRELSGECLNMRGISVSKYAAPIHLLFDKKNHGNSIFTIGIGDGGNEIGMGAIPWQVIADNILNGLGGKIACSIPANATIVAGVSNWAGYALIAGLYLYLGRAKELTEVLSESTESELMEIYFRSKSVVDGKLGIPAMSVDGIDWQIHLSIMKLMKDMIRIY
ncbi:MAG TPA: glutamate cyclase domain-containing protein [bacterium]